MVVEIVGESQYESNTFHMNIILKDNVTARKDLSL